MYCLEIDNIELSFGTTEILKAIYFKAEKGKVTRILGSNGSGKTSFLRIYSIQICKRSIKKIKLLYMKNSILLLFIIVFLSCKSEQKIQKPIWLIGKWKRTNEKPTKSTFDFWNKDLTGIGFTLKELDTVFKETMSIVTVKDMLYLKIEGVNEVPTLFKFTQQTDSSFVCENDENEFPKKIHYFLDKQQLKCNISNDEFSIDFIFNKTK